MNPTLTIKSKFSNAVHKLLEPNLGVKKSQRYRIKKVELTDKQKVDIFNQIDLLHNECSNDLGAYKFKKREKKRTHEARVKRGYVFKKKTSKADYEKMLQTA